MGGVRKRKVTTKLAGVIAGLALLTVAVAHPTGALAATRCAPVSRSSMKVYQASGPILVDVSGSSCQFGVSILNTYDTDHSNTGCTNATCDVDVAGWSCTMPSPKETWLTGLLASCTKSGGKITENGQWTRCPGFTQTHAIGGPSTYYGMQTWHVSCKKMQQLVWGSYWGKPVTSSGSTLDGVLWHGWHMNIGQEQASGSRGGASFSGFFREQGVKPLPWATLMGPG